MALDAVIAEIREKGQREVVRIQDETKSEVQAILAGAQTEVERIKMSVDEDVERQIAYLFFQENAAAKLVTKRELLNAQKELLDQVYEATGAAISMLPPEFHREAIRTLLMRISGEIPAGMVFCNERDMAVLKDIISETGISGFSVGDIVDIKGGILAESIDGELQLDYSYETLLVEVWESGLKDASNILFG